MPTITENIHPETGSGSSRSRRRFFRTVLAGLVGVPALLRAKDTSAPKQDSIKADQPRPTSPGDSVVHKRPPVRHGRTMAKPEMELLRPMALAGGATIAVVAPASGVTRGEVLDANNTLRKLGFTVKFGKHLTMSGGAYLAASDEERAKEFMDFVLDPEVRCIMAIRGGYGVMRILPMLDFDEIRRNPKIIIGFSDITALVNPVYQLSRVVAFHGPMATSSYDAFSLDSFTRVLMSSAPAGTFGQSDEFKGSRFGEAKATTLIPGKAQGRLVGGNLSLVSALLGTPYDIDTTGKILFLEEIEEEPYHIDRMLTQLALAGKLQAAAGIALGRFNKCEATGARRGDYRLMPTLEEVVRRAIEPLKIPAVYGLPIGHIHSKLTVPVGVLATLDADGKTLTLDEPAVSPLPSPPAPPMEKSEPAPVNK